MIFREYMKECPGREVSLVLITLLMACRMYYMLLAEKYSMCFRFKKVVFSILLVISS